MKFLDTQALMNNCLDLTDSLDNNNASNMEGVEIRPTDVLCGRGKNSFNHAGNRRFRDIVAAAIPGYVTASSRATKTEIVTKIVAQVRDNGGRFLKQDRKRKVWYVLNYTQSKEKAGHAIRDATITEESKKQRAQKRKVMRAASSGKVSPPPRRVSAGDLTVLDIKSHNDMQSQDYEIEGLNHSLCSLTKDVKSLDDSSTAQFGCLSSMLMAHFPDNMLPEETHSSSAFEPLPIDDPFNAYIDQLLGPMHHF